MNNSKTRVQKKIIDPIIGLEAEKKKKSTILITPNNNAASAMVL